MKWMQRFWPARPQAHKPPLDRDARRVIAERYRQLAFGPITDETRAADRQLLADAAAGKGRLL